MNLKMGSQTFVDVEIPLLWGDRAIVQDAQEHLSVVDLSGDSAHVEVLADQPAPGVEFRPSIDGLVILRNGDELYTYNAREKTLSGSGLGLPEVQISSNGTRVGTNWFTRNFIAGAGVGIAVSSSGISLATPLPPKLAKLTVQ